MAKRNPGPIAATTIVARASFTQDLRRRGMTSEEVGEFSAFREVLLTGEPLPPAYDEHPLIADWAGYLECHLAGDWLVIFKRFPGRVVLYRTGTHKELFKQRIKRENPLKSTS